MSFKTFLRSLPLLALFALPGFATAQVTVSVNIAPPVLPVYEQPPLPGDGYIWTPGYWAWSDDDQDYYWVPGTWVQAPEPDYLWTPGYWGFAGGAYLWHAGYWGPHIGFYGGVNYGFGYTGVGYQGGYWQGGHMYYNRDVVNVGSAHVTNVYNKTVINNVTVNRVSFNGGNGGTSARPTTAEEAASRDRHVAPTSVQQQHVQAAQRDPQFRAKTNGGHPAVAATARPGEFSGPGAVAARGAATHADTRAMTPQRPEHGQERAATQPAEPSARPAPHVNAPPVTHVPVNRPPVPREPATREPATREPPAARERAPEARAPEPRAQPVEPRREPEHTAPRAEPRAPQPRPPEHPPEQPKEHEHY